ncbi:MAG: TonB-dependent receptor [Alphaproteobacteria bacterium]|nr:TonB-dependent receptor [Alphaproteobacteria bacterium]
MSTTARLCANVSISALLFAMQPAHAQTIGAGLQPEYVIVTADRARIADPTAVDVQVTAAKAQEQINTVNTEDMLKYAPSLIVRKRHYGDTQDPVATRTSGLGASARNLIFVDGIMINSPIGNNNSAASPHFGVAAPQDVARIDVLYGPFAARYAGNSIGATINITTRMPDHFEFYGDVTGAMQNFNQYSTDQTNGTWQLSAGVGDRYGAFSWRLSANHLDSTAQPLAYVTLTRPAATSTAGTVLSGAFNDLNRTGAPIVEVGAGNIEHQVQDTDTLKLAYDFENGWQLAYTASLFHQDDDASTQSYLRDPTGNVVYTGNSNINGYNYNIAASSFSNSIYNVQQSQLAQGISLTSEKGGDFAWEIIASDFAYLNDKQRVPTAALPGAFTSGAGTVNRMNGTGWYTLDANGVWRGWSDHELSFGLHRDAETFAQTRNNLADWIAGGVGTVVNSAKGRTATNAVWAQDIWTLLPDLKASAGLRYEDWRAYGGNNFSASPALNVNQPRISASTLSPKATIAWQVSDAWRVTGSWGVAYRMPTVTELYQSVTTGTFLSVPNPNLKPERASSYELATEHRNDSGFFRLSLFEEDITSALLSQSAPLVPGSPTLFSYVQNVDRTQVRGVEFVIDQYDVLLPGLELMGSFTAADGRIRQDDAFTKAVGKFIPGVPKLKANALATYRIDDWAFTLGARYSDRTFGTIDNSDPISQTYQGFAGYFVVDTRARYKFNENWNVSVGVDNINNDKYFLFHPFPQRTFVMEVHYAQ